jgi:hypothetical protein
LDREPARRYEARGRIADSLEIGAHEFPSNRRFDLAAPLSGEAFHRATLPAKTINAQSCRQVFDADDWNSRTIASVPRASSTIIWAMRGYPTNCAAIAQPAIMKRSAGISPSYNSGKAAR